VRLRPLGKGLGGIVNVSAESGAVSGSHCNKLSELLRWFHPAESLSRSIIELEADTVEIGLGVHSKIAGSGEVLAQQPVGVLTRAALPGRMWVAKVNMHSGIDAEPEPHQDQGGACLKLGRKPFAQLSFLPSWALV